MAALLQQFSRFSRYYLDLQTYSTSRCFYFANPGFLTTNQRHFSSKPIPNYDVTVIGGGIVGMATAREILIRHPHMKIAVVEKENKIAFHQSGHNSGVIHAGIYYTPGSLRAKLCVSGLKKMYKYCDENNVPYKQVGKLIVAVNKEEDDRLDGLFERGLQNEVPQLQLLNSKQIREVEPNCRGIRAIHSPITGIVDYAEVTRSYSRNFIKGGGIIHTGFKVKEFIESDDCPEYPVTTIAHKTSTADQVSRIRSKYVVACAGLYSDKIGQLLGCKPEPKIVPFRGEYLLLKPEKSNLVRGNIYPVPNPKFPFLGFHFTPRMDGSVWLGPNALLAFKREGYNFLDFNLKELVDAVSYRGLQKLVLKNIPFAMAELYGSAFYTAQVKQLQKFVPDLKICDVQRGPSGVRAQALGRDGKLIDDFIFDVGAGVLGKRTLHVRNAPSPAATSSLAIGEMIVDKAEETFRF